MERLKDNVTGKEIARPIVHTKPIRNISQEIMAAFSDCTTAEKELVKHLADLLGKCLVVVPEQRITPEEALTHPFFTTKIATQPAVGAASPSHTDPAPPTSPSQIQ